MKTKIETTHDDVHELSIRLDKGRAKEIKVPRDVLSHYFRDHSRLIALCKDKIEGDV